MNLKTELNSGQLEAVTITEGPVAVFACAGSGKTRVITYRIAHLIADLGIQPSSILACTFTNKAAGEMKERVGKLIGSGVKGLWIGTFHSVCLRILRIDASLLGYTRQFTVLDEEDSLDIVKIIMRDLHIATKDLNPTAVRSAISGAKNMLVAPEEYAKKAMIPKIRTIAQIYKFYQERLMEMNAMDYDDLIGNVVSMLETHENIAEKYSNQFQYILVDEYQDINVSQHRLIKLLAKQQNIMVVGDDDQSIYAFRGATPYIMLQFDKDFPGAKIIKLEQNYRSTPQILDVASKLVEKNVQRQPKRLISTLKGIDTPRVYVGLEPSDEASYVVSRIKELTKDGRSYKDYAVLYRTNAQSRPFEDSFMAAGIPYMLIGGIRFYQRKEIKDLLSYLKTAQNPKDGQSFRRAIVFPRRGIGPMLLAKLEAHATTKKATLEASLREMVENGEFSDVASNGARNFLEILNGIREKANTSPAQEVVMFLIQETRIIQALRDDGSEDGETRAQNVEEFLNLATEFAKSSDDQSLDAFLATVALLTEQDTVKDDEPKVLMTTVHQAKGLEFPVVFLCGLEEGTFPHFRSIESEGDVEEERRLAYVGITRAKEILHLSRVINRQIWGLVKKCDPSRFFHDIKDAKLQIESKSTHVEGSTFTKRYNLEPKLPKKEPVAVNVGDVVEHQAWGEGTVVIVDGQNAEVDFKTVGIKLLNMRYAPIKRKEVS